MNEAFLHGRLLHGGDYNPDQWLKYPEILEEDIRLMKLAHVNEVSLGIFAWSKLEPSDGVYDFDWLKKIIDRLYENGIYTILATPTGAVPMWMSESHEEVRMMTEDGIRRLPGERHNFCPSSPYMREKMRAIDERLAETFGHHPGVIAWHISNEYGGHYGDCHCPHCQAAFREWLKKKYGTLDHLNDAWWTGFWSHTYTDWDQIHAPSRIGENTLHGQKLDWRRFVSDQMLDFCEDEIRSVRKFSDRPVTTNFMMFFKPHNYFKWAKALDVVSFDSYPAWHNEADDVRTAMATSMNFATMRSLKKQPFLLMESTPSATNWMKYNMLKRPGMHELSSLQAVADGADSVQYFQWRKGRGGSEKFHGAVVDHRNGANTRVFRDVTRVGERLEAISSRVLGTVNQADAALVFDWENWWDVEDAQAVTNPVNYLKTVLSYYEALWKMGITTDIVDMDSDLSDYKLVVAPMNYMYRGSYMEKVREFTKRGGTYVTTYWSGEVDDTDLCFLGSHPLRDLLGIETEEIDAPTDLHKNEILYDGTKYETTGLCALVHAESAAVLATYQKDFYVGYPALTRNYYGDGRAYFIASENEQPFVDRFLAEVCAESGVTSGFDAELPYGVTVSCRKAIEEKKRGEAEETAKKPLYFLQNFNNADTNIRIHGTYTDIETGNAVSGETTLSPYQCLILE